MFINIVCETLSRVLEFSIQLAFKILDYLQIQNTYFHDTFHDQKSKGVLELCNNRLRVPFQHMCACKLNSE